MSLVPVLCKTGMYVGYAAEDTLLLAVITTTIKAGLNLLCLADGL